MIAAFLQRLFGSSKRPSGVRTYGANPGAYDSTATTRVNANHWRGADSTDPDGTIVPALETQRNRARLELRNSGYAKGLQRTYTDDMLGEEGPTLQIRILGPMRPGEPNRVASLIEAGWEAWCEVADMTGRQHFTDLLTTAIKQFWDCGEFLWHTTTDNSAPARSVQLRVLAIAADRLCTPSDQLANENIRGGVEIDDEGRIVQYHILQQHPGSLFATYDNFERLPAAAVLHAFLMEAPDQHRGEPWLQNALENFAQFRDYTKDVVLAARMAGMFCGIAKTTHQSIEFDDLNNELPIWDLEPGQVTFLPQGWEIEQMKPNQPPAGFADFKKEILSEAGRVVGMPWLKVACDASGHNYSSARLDLQCYWQGIKALRGYLCRQVLNPLVAQVVREMIALGEIPTGVQWRPVWGWPPIPQIDPNKEATASETRLNSGTSTLRDEAAANGRDWEELQEQIARERQNAERLGIPPPGTVPAPQPAVEADDDEEESDDEATQGSTTAA